VAHRCFLIGLDLPSESTVGCIIATTVAIAQPNLDASSKHALLLDFKRKLKAKCKGTIGEASLSEFPPNPRDLPEARFNHAYSNSQPTTYWDTHSLGEQNNVPLRRTSSKLRTAEPEIPALAMHRPSSMPDMMQQWGGMLLQNLFSNHQAGFAAPSNPLLNFRPPAPRPHLQIGDLNVSPHHSSPNPPTQSTPLPHQTPPLSIADREPNRDDVTEPKSDDGVTPFSTPHIDDPAKYSETVLGAIDNRQEAKKRPAAAPKGKAKSDANAKKTKLSSSSKSAGSSNRPSIPSKGSGTVWYLDGKIHRSDTRKAWRVFICSSDRCDKVTC
jgi:hypothetical protein